MCAVVGGTPGVFMRVAIGAPTPNPVPVLVVRPVEAPLPYVAGDVEQPIGTRPAGVHAYGGGGADVTQAGISLTALPLGGAEKWWPC